MPDAFTLFGTLKADTAQFEASLRRAEQRLEEAEDAITKTERRSKDLGRATATTGREFEKLNDRTGETARRLTKAVEAFSKGEMSAKQFARAVNQAESGLKGVTSRVKDMDARFTDMAAKSKGWGFGSTILGANLLSNALGNLSGQVVDFTREGIRMNATLDQMARLVANLDASTQNAKSINNYKQMFTDLSRQMPQTAENIAESARILKSALPEIGNNELPQWLLQFGKAATTAGTDVGSFTNSLAALAKAYKVELKDLPSFLAAVATANKRALASDPEVAKSFNQTISAIQGIKVPLNTYLAQLGTLASQTNDVNGATTNLVNLYQKLGDPNYIKGFKEVFNTELFDPATGAARDFTDVLEDLMKSLDGLTDEQRTTKINAVFKDMQARNAFVGLLRGREEYRKALVDGADLKQFERANEIMLSSVESRWQRFWNGITGEQSNLGGNISRIFLNAFDSSTVLGGVEIFFQEVIGGIIKAGDSVVDVVGDAGLAIGQTIAQAFGSDGSWWQSVRDDYAKYHAQMRADADRAVTNMNTTVLARQRDSLQKIADMTNDPALKTKMLGGVADLNKAIAAQYADINMEPLKAGLRNGIMAATRASHGPATQSAFKVGEDIGEGLVRGMRSKMDEVGATASMMGKTADSALRYAVRSHSPSEVFHDIGTDIGQGLANGMNAMKPVVDRAARELVNKDQFKGIAKDIAESFRDATAKLEISMPGAGAALGLPGFIAGLSGKDGAAAVALAGELIKKLAEMNAETNTQQILLTLAEGKYGKLTEAQREFIKALAAGLDAEEKTKDAVQKLVDIQEDFNDQFQKAPSAIEMVNEALRDTAALEKYAASVKMTTDEVAKFLRRQAWLKDALDLAASRPKNDIAPPPITPSGTRDTAAPGGVDVTIMPPTREWEEFWKTFRNRAAQMKKELPSLKQALGETFVDTLGKAADVLANAVANWDGTLKGFFRSVKEGFRQMISEIIQQLIRLMIMKAVLSLIGAAAGGAGGADGSAGGSTSAMSGADAGILGSKGIPVGRAGGGLIQGPGSGTSDSILSWLSNGEYVIPAKAVRKFGVGFFEQIRNMQTPALAGGGMMPATAMGSSSSSYAYHNNVTVNLSGGGSDGRTGSQIARETMIALRRMEERNR